MRARSLKRQREMVARRALVASLLAAEPRCQAQWSGCTGWSVDVHERLSRARGGDILDPVQAHMVTVCRACHTRITQEVRLAEQMRMLLPSWHACPPCGPC